MCYNLVTDSSPLSLSALKLYKMSGCNICVHYNLYLPVYKRNYLPYRQKKSARFYFNY